MTKCLNSKQRDQERRKKAKRREKLHEDIGITYMGMVGDCVNSLKYYDLSAECEVSSTSPGSLFYTGCLRHCSNGIAYTIGLLFPELAVTYYIIDYGFCCSVDDPVAYLRLCLHDEFQPGLRFNPART